MDYMDEFQFFSPYMESGEYVLWQGKPGKGNFFSSINWAIVVFSLFWLCFSLCWEAAAIASGAPVFFAFFGLPFIIIGVLMLYNGLFRHAGRRGKSLYLITNRRILVKNGNNLSIYRAEDLSTMKIRLHKNGNGTIIFSENVYTRRGRSYSVYLMLENLPDVAQAQSAISRMENSQIAEKM